MSCLALNIIVGPGDTVNLFRLLKLCDAGNTFDEVVIVNTIPGIKNLNTKFKEVRYTWENDFASARNVALDNTESDYVMWLDCDDIPMTPLEILEIKRAIQQVNPNYCLIPYIVGDGQSMLLRERIFKRQSSVRWVEAIHEQIDLRFTNNKFVTFTNTAIRHDDEGRGTKGLLRNIAIMENVEKTPHILFNLANDLYTIGIEKERAISIFEQLIKDHILINDTMIYACTLVSRHYSYDKTGRLIIENLFPALLYANLAVSFGDKIAEPHIIMGDYYLTEEKLDKAITEYQIAYNKKNGASSACTNMLFTAVIPATRLSKVYSLLKEIELALYYNKIAMSFSPSDQALQNNRKEYLEQLK